MKLSTGYKKVAYYLKSFADVPLAEFITLHPGGFFVEQSQGFASKSVASQFFTQVLDDESVLRQLEKKSVQADILDARVIEIRKKKSATDSDALSIGRSPLSDIVISNKLVSRTHAHLELDKACYLIDLGSANGTFLNGEKMTPRQKYQLTSSDEISFGPEIKFFYFSSEAFHSLLARLGFSRADI